MKNTKKRLLCICLIFVLLWAAFALTRYSAFTTYLPFTGKLFSVDGAAAEAVFVQNGTTGEQHFFETAGEKAEIARQLNDLRYRFWFPRLPIATGGWSWRVAIEAEGKQYSYTFGEKTMTVNGIVYVLSEAQLDALRQYVE